MGNSLEERLQAHSNAFDGLLSLIPAKYYYDEDTSTQWQQKRKSKEELKNNKRQKLDPTLTKNATAKDVLKEAEKTALPVVLPGEKLKAKLQQKKVKGDESKEEDEEDEEDEEEEGKENDGFIGYGSEELEISDIEDENKATKEKTRKEKDANDELIKDKVTIIFDDNGDFIEGEENVEHNKLMNRDNVKAKQKKALTKEEQEEKKKNMTELRSKLQEKILNLKEKRKAPGTKVQGAATSRQQILEERRKKQELRKEMLKKKRDSGETTDDDSSSDDEGEEDEDKTETSNVMFGNIEFMDGEKISSDLTAVRKIGKKKGPANKDIKGHLKKIEKEKFRLDQMDKDSRDKFEEKSKWKRALASVQGDKLKDDEKLLKKALRRKESQKRKSEREWKERKQTVADHIRKKQERREENLRIRKENKGKGRQQQQKQLSSYKMGRSKKASDGKGAKRAGFEGGTKRVNAKTDK